METKGDRLRVLRLKKDLTLDEAGKFIGKNRQAVYKYEKNIVTNIPSDVIEKLSVLYDTTPAYILGWEVEKTEKGRELKHQGESFYVELTNPNSDVSEIEMIGHIEDAFRMAAEQVKDPKILEEMKKSILYQNKKSDKRSDAYAEINQLLPLLDEVQLEQLCSYARFLAGVTK